MTYIFTVYFVTYGRSRTVKIRSKSTKNAYKLAQKYRDRHQLQRWAMQLYPN